MVKITFDLENSNVKVMAKVKPIGHIWGLEFNRYVCFSFHGNRTTFGWDIANSIVDLENSRLRSWPRSHPMVTFEALRSIDMFAFVSWQLHHFWLRYSKFHIWPWKFKVKVMTNISQTLIRANNHANNERNPKSCSKVIAWTTSNAASDKNFIKMKSFSFQCKLPGYHSTFTWLEYIVLCSFRKR